MTVMADAEKYVVMIDAVEGVVVAIADAGSDAADEIVEVNADAVEVGTEPEKWTVTVSTGLL
jgi:hypothetical protein